MIQEGAIIRGVAKRTTCSRQGPSRLRGLLLLGFLLLSIANATAQDDRQEPASILTSPALGRLFSTEWTTNLPVLDASFSPAALTDDSVIVLTNDRHLVSLSSKTGSIQWYVPISSTPIQSPLVGSMAIILLGESGDLSAFDKETGLHIWDHVLSSPRRHPGIILSSEAVVAFGKGWQIFALDEKDGHILWQESASADSRIAASGSTCCFAAAPKQLVGKTIRTGEELWRANVNGNILTLVSAPTDEFCVLTTLGSVYALDQDTGRIRWKCDTELTHASAFNASFLLPAQKSLLVFGRPDPFAPRRILAIDRSNGVLLWTGVYPELDAIPTYHSGHFLYFSRGRLYIVNAADGAIRRGIHTSAPPSFLGAHKGSSFVALPGSGAFKAKLNLKEFLTQKQSQRWIADEIPAGTHARAVLWGLLFLILAVGSATVFAKSGKPQVPSTTQTLLFQYSLLLTTFGLIVITAFASLLGTWFCLTRSFSWGLFTFSTSLSLPTVTALTSIALFVRSTFSMRTEEGDSLGIARDLDATIQEVVDTLSQEMGISHKVPVAIDPRNHIAPVVAGIFPRVSRLIIPNNFRELIKEACEGKKRLETALTRFVLAHELAHVKNHDTLALPFVSALQGPWVLCSVLTGVLYFVNSRFLHDPAITFLGRPLIWIFFLGTCFLLLATRMLLVSREKLADATASLCISPEDLRQLTGTSEKSRGSPLRRFIISVLPFYSLNRPNVRAGISGIPRRLLAQLRRMVPAFPRQISHFLVRLQDRLETITSKHHVFSHRPFPTFGESIVVSVLAALLYLYLLLAEHYVFVTYSFLLSRSIAGDTKEYYSDALKATISWYNESPDWHLLEIYSLFGIGLAVSAMMLLPSRDLPPASTMSSAKSLSALVLRFVIMLTLCLTVITLLKGWFPLFPLIGASTLALVVGVVVGAGLLLFALEFRADIGRSKHYLVASAIFMICIIASTTAIGVLFFQEIPVLSRMICVLSFSMVCLALGTINPRWNPLGSQWLFSGEELVASRILWLRILSPMPGNIREAICGPAAQCLFCLALTGIAVPALVFTVLVYPTLVGIDLWYEEQPSRLNRTLAQFSDEALSKSSPKGKIAVLLLAERILRPDGSLPSEVIGIGGVLLLSPMSIYVMATRAYIRRRSQLYALSEVLKLQRVERVLGKHFAKDKLLERVLQEIIPQRINKHGYVTGTGGVPLMRLTCESIQLLQEMGLASAMQNRAVPWILNCEVKGGGFAPAPGMSPTILHTHAALVALTAAGIEKTLDSQVHRRWLYSRFVQLTEDIKTKNPQDWLRNLCLLLEATKLIGIPIQFSPLERTKLSTATLHQWHKSDKSFLSTCYCVSVLDAIGGGRSYAFEQIRAYWLSTNERILSTMAPRHRLDDIWAGLTIVRILYPKDFLKRPVVAQIRDNLIKVYGTTV